MENVSRALVIAGAVLIAILVLSLGLVLFAKFSARNKEYRAIVSNIEMEKYNSQFTVYMNRTDLVPEDIVTAINLAKEYSDMRVYVYDDSYPISQDNPADIIGWYRNETFSCSNYTFDSSGKITSISFSKN